jgi:hypothetical protein
MKKIVFSLLVCFLIQSIHAQETDSIKAYKEVLDSIYIEEVENQLGPAKVLHAEPLFIDLIRDLGARKGEKEWNVGFGLTDNKTFDEYLALVEYEWAPIDRLGLEIELPFLFYFNTENGSNPPQSRLQSLKLAAQYSFFVSEKAKTSMALGYIHEIELTGFKQYGKERFFEGNVFNPFFVAAKRWGQNFHTLIYTGPQFLQHFDDKPMDFNWQINSNFHYMISGTRNFIGLEVNKDLSKGYFDMTLRPQMRVAVSEHLLIGIVTGVNVIRKGERFSSFFRIIYEPKHK